MSACMSICETATATATFAAAGVVENNNGGGSGGTYTTQNNLLLKNLLKFYEQGTNLDTMLKIINGHSKISLRIIDWFATNYAKKFYTVYTIQNTSRRFKVYVDYKLKLKAYSKKRFDPFCRWDRITIPYKDGTFIQTTIGQLNFFKWAIENDVVHCIEENYQAIENDMNSRNSTSKHSRSSLSSTSTASEDCDICDTQSATTTTEPNSKADKNKTRKKREELSISATKSIKKEKVEIVVSFE
jgi:membrane-associated HD superfamily phosphohydrolase